MKPFSFYLVTDTHYFEKELGAEGRAFEDYMSREQYFMKESSAIIESVFDRIAEDTETDIVLIPGDLTKNGELESHKSFVKELYRLKEKGKKIFVITAGHDYGNDSFAFRNDKRISVEGAPFEILNELYKNFGYGDAIAFDEPTHSYVAEICDGVRMLGICCDSLNQPKGAMDDRLSTWTKEQLDKAKEDNCYVFAICHYPVIPPVPVFDLVGDTKVREWRKVASLLADNGVEFIMTGHMHAQSINEFYSEKGNRLIDICTSCLVGSPAKYRKITIDENSVMKVQSIDVENTGADTNGLSAQEYFDRQFKTSILGKIFHALDGGKGFIKALKQSVIKMIKNMTVGQLAHLLLFRVDKHLGKKKLVEFISEIGICIFKGDQPYVDGTPEHKLISSFLRRFSFILKKVEPKLSKDGIKINLEEMLLGTIGNNKKFSDNNAEFHLKGE